MADALPLTVYGGWSMTRIVKRILVIVCCLFSFYPGNLHAAVTDSISLTPPMGWNSYDCYCYTVNEAQVKANTDYMADSLKKFGWQYIVIDYVWSAPIVPGVKWSPSQDGNFQNPHLNMDQYGRQLPDTTRFPSAKGGNGFKPIADYIHGKGLKFGIHIMRGNTPAGLGSQQSYLWINRKSQRRGKYLKHLLLA